MTKSTITREQLRALAVKKIESLKFAITQSAYTGIRCRLEEELQLAEFALAAMDSEPVAWTEKCEITNMQATGLYLRGFPDNSHGRDIPLYRHAHPAPVALKDHQMRELVNQLRDTAIQYHGTQQLREQIARVIRAAMLQAEPVTTANKLGNSPVIPDGYVMVPKEPTESMINAWLSEVANWRGHIAGYKAMLAAAPQGVKQ
ncbi:hypothetical protein ACU632_17155 [Klebsiella aerogenes]